MRPDYGFEFCDEKLFHFVLVLWLCNCLQESVSYMDTAGLTEVVYNVWCIMNNMVTFA